MNTVHLVREVLEQVRGRFGRVRAVEIIENYGHASSIAQISEHLYDRVIEAGEALLDEHHSDRLSRAAGLLQRRMNALFRMRNEIMAAMDDLKGAVDGAVNEMSRAGDYIRNHPAAQNDAQLMDFANRLKAASEALGGVDVEQAAAGGSSGATGDTGSGSSAR